MKITKRILALVLLGVICLSLCACGLKKEEAIGVWKGEYEYKNDNYVSSFVLSENGKYAKVVFKNGTLSSTEEGTFEIDGSKVVLNNKGVNGGSTVYKYRGGKLINNGHKFIKE